MMCIATGNIQSIHKLRAEYYSYKVLSCIFAFIIIVLTTPIKAADLFAVEDISLQRYHQCGCTSYISLLLGCDEIIIFLHTYSNSGEYKHQIYKLMHNIQTEYDHKIKGYGRNTTYCSWLSGVQSGLTKLKDVYLYIGRRS